MPLAQVAQVENNLTNLARRMPKLPVTELLILRMAIILGRDLNARFDELLKPAGLSEAEFRLLLALYSHGGSAFAGEVCAALAQSPANLTRLGDSLVAQGHVSRDPDAADRRKMLLSLKPSGEALLCKTLPGMSTNVAATFKDFSAAEKKHLVVSLKRLLAGIEGSHLQSPPGLEKAS